MHSPVVAATRRRNHRGALGRTCAWLATIAALAVASAVAAQIPGLPKLTQEARPPEAAPAAAPETAEQAIQRIQRQVDAARAVRDRLDRPAADAGVPDGVGPDEISAARQAIAALVFALEGQLRVVREAGEARKARAEAEAANKGWTGFPEKPPYSMMKAEDLHDAVESVRTRLTALEAGKTIASRELERYEAESRRADAALRKAREAAAAPSVPPAANWRVEMAAWAARAAAAVAEVTQRRLEWGQDQIATERERLELTLRQLETVRAKLRFDAADLERVRQAARERAQRIEKQESAARSRAIQAARERDEAARALDALRTGPAGTPAKVATAEARLRAAEAAVVTSRLETDVLEGLAAVARGGPDVWTLRYDALTAPDADQRRQAVARLRVLAERMTPWREYANAQLELVHAAQLEHAARLAQVDVASDAIRYERAVDEALRQRAAAVQLLRDATTRIDRTLARWLAEIDVAQAGRPWADRAAGYWSATAEVVRRAWNFELFDVEDTVEADGRKVTITRGVTIGKSVGAMLLFLFGYWLAARIARGFEALLVRHFAVEAAPARTTRRWVLTLFAFVLLVVTLNLARIPLTVFAFLGGALAIGVGFGTQTIIKNFISGMIVLMERQVRVGDTVDVDNVTGTVTEVNLRSSTIRGFDGVEAIIPNSTLLEQRVTNWTRSDRKVRRVVKVGVAYGSPVREVADIMKQCAERHGLVLKDPEPLVLLEDFGDNALAFGLYVWVDLKPGVSAAVVMSDLRFMLEKHLGEAGIVIAFPQRDVHIDASMPLRVEIQRPRQSAAAGG